MVESTISVIIPTRNRQQSLIKTLDSMYSSEVKPNQIVVVDQSDIQEDLGVELAKRYPEITITYFYLKQPSSTKARNIGIELVENDIIIFSDDDVLVDQDTFKNILQVFENNNIALIAGIDKRGVQGTNKINNLFSYLFQRKLPNEDKGYIIKSMIGRYPTHINKQLETEWAMGYFFAVKKEVIINSGIRWDENLTSYAYAEDLDFSYRLYKYLKERNLKMVLNPLVVVEHCVSNEWRLTSKQQTLMFILNREYLSYKLFNNFSSLVFTRWANVGEFCRRLLLKDHPVDVIKAQLIVFKYRKFLKRGEIPMQLYDLDY